MKKKELVVTLNDAIKDLENENKNKYIIDYRMEGYYIRIFSNNGKSRKVKFSKGNMFKLNKKIVKNKIKITNKCNELEETGKFKRFIFFISLIILCGSGCIVPTTLFIGSYELFLLSIILFSFTVIYTSILGFSFCVNTKEIIKLKNSLQIKNKYKKNLRFLYNNRSLKDA